MGWLKYVIVIGTETCVLPSKVHLNIISVFVVESVYSTGEESSVLITELQTQLPEEKVRDWGGLEIPLATHQVALQQPQDLEGDDDICSDDWDTELEDEGGWLNIALRRFLHNQVNV